MNDDIKSLLGSALRTDGPPSIVDVDALERAGARAARRRSLGLAGGTAAGIAAITAGALVLSSAFAGSGVPGTETPAGPATATVIEFPDLDPDLSYTWWLASLNGDADDVARYTGILTEAPPPGQKEWEAPDPEDAVLVAPLYGLTASAGWSEAMGYLTGTELALDGTGDALDMLEVTLLPPGAYVTGYDDTPNVRAPRDGHMVQGCEDYEITDAHEGTGDDRTFTFECDTVTVDGVTIERVTETETYTASPTVSIRHSVVAYQSTGTAVRLSVIARPGVDWVQGSGSFPDAPTLDLDALTALVAAIPPVTIDVD